MENDKHNEMLWSVAKKRAAFKYGLATYVIVNLFLIGIWYFTDEDHNNFWPIWGILGWGMGVAFQYFSAYHGSKTFSAEAEYDKLKNKESK